VGGIHPVFEAVLLLKHTPSISSGMEGDEDPLPHHIYIYISIIELYQKISFLLLSNEISLLPLVPSFSFSEVLIDFLTIRKYRKKDLNNILLFAIFKPYHLEMAVKNLISKIHVVGRMNI
jgi:hypothetical protein